MLVTMHDPMFDEIRPCEGCGYDPDHCTCPEATVTTKLTRYTERHIHGDGLSEAEDGEYVLFADHQAEIERLCGENTRLRDALELIAHPPAHVDPKDPSYAWALARDRLRTLSSEPEACSFCDGSGTVIAQPGNVEMPCPFYSRHPQKSATEPGADVAEILRRDAAMLRREGFDSLTDALERGAAQKSGGAPPQREPMPDLQNLRRLAADVLSNPADASVPRAERDLVITAEDLIWLLDEAAKAPNPARCIADPRAAAEVYAHAKQKSYWVHNSRNEGWSCTTCGSFTADRSAIPDIERDCTKRCALRT